MSTRGPWSRQFLLWTALLDEPLEVLDPPELVAVAQALGHRLGDAA